MSFTSDVISVPQYNYMHSVKTLTREFLNKLKNPDLDLNGNLKPVSKRQKSHRKNVGGLPYDNADPFAVAKA